LAIGSTGVEALDSVRGATVPAQPLSRTAETTATKKVTLLDLDNAPPGFLGSPHAKIVSHDSRPCRA
jgi:hypothetical protein